MNLRRALGWLALVLGGLIIGGGVWLLRFGLPGEGKVLPLPSLLPPPSVSATKTPEIPLQSDGSPYPSLFIPAAGVREYIIESYLDENGWQVNHLGNRIGHLQGTTLPGGVGNVVLAGHVEAADGSPAVFAEIGKLAPGDLIQLINQGQLLDYRVTEVKTVPQDDLSVVYPVAGINRITLITCTGYSFISGTYTERVVVVGERASASE